MTGLLAARMFDSTADSGLIVDGSQNVLIGSQGGAVGSGRMGSGLVGSQVDPQMGAKVLYGKEGLDFALPGPLPVVWQRQYSSHVNAAYGAACGMLGHGWHLPCEMTLELREGASLLFDAAGRAIAFETALAAGEMQYSGSENIYLLRGGLDGEGNLPLWQVQKRFEHISKELAGDENCIIAAGGTADILLVFTPASVAEQAVSKADTKKVASKKSDQPPESAEADSGQRWRLTAQVDRYGRSQRYQYSTGREPVQQPSESKSRRSGGILRAGLLLSITDGAGRLYRLYYRRFHPGKNPVGPWGADDGWRLVSVVLEGDPLNRLPAPITLVSYDYNGQGQLTSVHDRTGASVHQFEWIRRRISAHRTRGGPWHRYRYAGIEPNVRVAVHTSEEGLEYQFQYKKERPLPGGKLRYSTTVTDSLRRVQIYCYEGAAGLERLVEHRRANGSVIKFEYDGSGRCYASTDPLGRPSYTALAGNGNILSTQQPGDKKHPAGLRTSNKYDEAGYLIEHQDVAGDVTGYQYDQYKRLIRITLPDGSIERRHYPDPKELPLICDSPNRIEDARGGETRLVYSNAGRLIRYIDCSGRSTEYDYDRWGDIIKITDAQDNSTRHKRDETGRIIETQLPDSDGRGQIRRYQYDGQGNLIRIEPDENTPGSALEIGRDLWGRPLTFTQGGLSITLQWDVAGRLTHITNENGAQSWFVWDELDQLKQEVGFDGRVHRYGYDKAGQLGVSGDGTGADQTDLVTRYSHNVQGRLIERRIPATENSPAQSHRYEWDAAGRLKTASVYRLIALPQGGHYPQVQSQVEFERNKLGRVTAETQRLYKLPQQLEDKPLLENEYRIDHQLDKLGNRLQTQLQDSGSIQWLRYGEGHVHGLMFEGQSLIDFERDALHRETQRTFNGPQQKGGLILARWYDNLGRLDGIRLQGLAQQNLTRIPSVLVGQMESRHYQYDALNQLTAIEMPDRVLGFGYDSAGRLRSQALYDPDEYLRATVGNAKAKETQHWEIDPAGNRMPSKLTDEREQRQNWAKLSHLRWKDPKFNLLGEGNAKKDKGPLDKWEDNRIGYYEDYTLRYDLLGNRTEQLSFKKDENGQYSRQRYGYDGAHQLTDVKVARIVGRGQVVATTECRYIHDALGRRLKKIVKNQDGQEHITYFGWDGDQLVHIETPQEDGSRKIERIIYEPGTFTPLVRLSTRDNSQRKGKPSLLELFNLAGRTPGQWNSPELAREQDILRRTLERQIRQAVEQGPSEQTRSVMRGMGIDPAAWRAELNQSLEELKKSGQPVEIHYFHCDHLGTPIALTDQQGNIAWAVRLDPWGNILEEYNPNNIDQPLRLPGQYHDRETDLYYNYCRYYDPKIGAYINQDPIGLGGGLNEYRYPANPLRGQDPLGLQSVYDLAGWSIDATANEAVPIDPVSLRIACIVDNLNPNIIKSFENDTTSTIQIIRTKFIVNTTSILALGGGGPAYPAPCPVVLLPIRRPVF